MSNNNDVLCQSDLILYKFIFANDDWQFGIVVKVESDLNYFYIYNLLTSKGLLASIPASCITYKIIKKSV